MKKFTFTLIALFCMLTANEVAAQPPGPGGGGTVTPGCDTPGCIPIDGGLSWLLIAGTVYGGKKLYKANKTENEEL